MTWGELLAQRDLEKAGDGYVPGQYEARILDPHPHRDRASLAAILSYVDEEGYLLIVTCLRYRDGRGWKSVTVRRVRQERTGSRRLSGRPRTRRPFRSRSHRRTSRRYAVSQTAGLTRRRRAASESVRWASTLRAAWLPGRPCRERGAHIRSRSQATPNARASAMTPEETRRTVAATLRMAAGWFVGDDDLDTRKR